MNDANSSPECSFDSHPVPPEKQHLFIDKAPPVPFMIGNYRILGSLGHGGMGIVYLAENVKLAEPGCAARREALKVILPQHMSPQALTLFLAEMRSLSRLTHENIATLYYPDVLETPDGPMPYFTMEYIRGALPITRYAVENGLLLEQRLKLLISAANGVAHAHSAGQSGIAHSDIKPANLLVRDDGVVKVVDFGGAVDLSQALPRVRVLTPAYAAPEQLRRQELFLQSDVYSLAVVGYQLLVQQFPLSPHSGVPSGAPVPIRQMNPRVSMEIEQVLLNALHPDPQKRYANAGKFSVDLQNACRGDFVLGEERRLGKRVRVFCRKNRQEVFVGLVLFLGLAGTSWQAWEASKERDREHAARLYADSLRRSTDRAMAFVKQLIYTTDTYNVRDQTLNIDLLLSSAESRLSVLEGDTRATAIALGALGRIAADWGHFEQGAVWLSRSADMWRKLAESQDDTSASAKQELIEVLNHLAWARVGSTTTKTDLVDRAKRALPSAEEAFRVQRELTGPLQDDTLCLQADLLRIRQLAGDPGILDTFMEFMATATQKTKPELVQSLMKTIAEAAQLQQSGERKEAQKKVLQFVQPLIEPSRPRFRGRIPWSLAQAADFMRSVPPAIAFMMGTDHEHLSACAITVLDVSEQIGADILAEGHPDIHKIADLRKTWDMQANK